MATDMEMSTWQRDKLFTLLTIRENNKGIKINRLDELIVEAETVMKEEDVALVEKKIAQLYSYSERHINP